MAVKTFTTEVLTSADTNTYLANSGLVYVTSTTFSGSSSVSVNNCFTSTYDNYRILFVMYGSSGGAQGYFRLRASSSDKVGASYFMTGYSNTWNTTLTSYNAGSQTFMTPVGLWSSSIPSGCALDIYGPANATINTNWSARVNDAGGGGAYVRDAVYAVTEAQDGFTVFGSAGTITGTITIYGYRKA